MLGSQNNSTPPKQREYLILFAIALMVGLVIAALEPVPGYMDADYYFAGGKQLAGGRGLYEPFLWNYLDHPKGLPHPSNSYWNPLASFIAAGGMLLTGGISFISARIGFILIASLAPLVIMTLSFRISGNRRSAFVAGLLATFSGYYLPFIVTTDNYGLYMLLGGLFFLLLDRLSLPKAALLGLIAGAFNLARGDGLLWLPLTIFAVVVMTFRQTSHHSTSILISRAIMGAVLVLLGYLAVMGPWFMRNLHVFGMVLPPGSGNVLWMTSYNQLFSFTPEKYTFQSWLASGLPAALKVRAEVLWQNLVTAFFAQGMIFLVPLILLGGWKLRRSFLIQFGVLGWLCVLFSESLLFPFASVQGGYFHAGTAFQPLLFAIAPCGLDVIIDRVNSKGTNLIRNTNLIQSIVVVIMILFSIQLIKIRVVDSGWNEGEYLYLQTDQFLEDQDVSPGSIIMVRNPPAYFIMTGRQAIVIPDGDVKTLLAASRKYNASYVLLEPAWKNGSLQGLYEHPESYPEFSTLGELGESHLLFIKPSP